jgi:hypothetical protein
VQVFRKRGTAWKHQQGEHGEVSIAAVHQQQQENNMLQVTITSTATCCGAVDKLTAYTCSHIKRHAEKCHRPRWAKPVRRPVVSCPTR